MARGDVPPPTKHHLVIERAGERGSAPANPTLDRADRAAAGISGLQLRVAVGAYQQDRPALDIGQHGNGQVQFFQGKHMILSRLLEQSIRQDTIDVLDFPLGLPQIGDEGVMQDREQPGAQLGIGLVLVPIRPSLEERGLNQILGAMFVDGQLQRPVAQDLPLRWQ